MIFSIVLFNSDSNQNFILFLFISLGGWLDYLADGRLFYQSGRTHPYTYWSTRVSQHFNKTRDWMKFTDSKFWLVNKGVAHWGDSVEIFNSEFYDFKTGAMMFGAASIQNSLIVGYSNNPGRLPATSWWITFEKMGFQVKYEPINLFVIFFYLFSPFFSLYILIFSSF